MLRVLAAVLILLAAAPALTKISAGTLVDLGTVRSKYSDPRRVTVWLPSSYKPDGPRHAVLYMHDGQNLFDPQDGYGGQEWKIDETLDRLIRENKVRPTIVVGIWNTPKRAREYVPAKVLAALPPDYRQRALSQGGGQALSDGYLKFIVKELKPQIDRQFRVITDRSNTVIMGSSMGGLISLYGIAEYPGVFGGAGMISTHWPIFFPSDDKAAEERNYEVVSNAFERYLATALPSPANHRVYFDHGTGTLDAYYARYQERVDRVVAKRGYHRDRNWISRNFPGQAHDEASWASRVEIPLKFLLRVEK